MRRHCLLAALLAATVGVAVLPAEERLSSAAGDIVIQPLAHASVHIQVGGRSIYIDPWSGGPLASLPTSDLIIVTDADNGAHHLDPKALLQLRRAGGTVVVPASGTAKVPDGVVLGNGVSKRFGDVLVEAVAAYDLTPGDPFHAKGVGNGYVLTLGGKRVYFAGVTECVPEIQALRNIDVAFMPMNLPNGRMTPAAVAECARSFRPKVVYPYHYDQGYLARLAGRGDSAGAATAAASVRALADALKGVAEVREGNWYPVK
ncbi:MAG TPA: MBL fold metallo-hydrolase [Vicinamibacterales bacterium]|nr:MBL fold metallo-hydrolase [Vicinamibacterales bacterium]